MNDELIAEVRKNREDLLHSYNGDVDAMMKDLMQKQWHSNHNVVSPQDANLISDSSREVYPIKVG
jgi:hypothetical protein